MGRIGLLLGGCSIKAENYLSNNNKRKQINKQIKILIQKILYLYLQTIAIKLYITFHRIDM